MLSKSRCGDYGDIVTCPEMPNIVAPRQHEEAGPARLLYLNSPRAVRKSGHGENSFLTGNGRFLQLFQRIEQGVDLFNGIVKMRRDTHNGRARRCIDLTRRQFINDVLRRQILTIWCATCLTHMGSKARS